MGNEEHVHAVFYGLRFSITHNILVLVIIYNYDFYWETEKLI